MATPDNASLIMLSDSDRTIADPAEDIRGRRVCDKHDNDLGKVDDLLVDADEGKVRMLRVEHGGLLGFGATPSFVPVDAVTRITDETVYVAQSRDEVADAPRYDPDLTDETEYYGSLYGYYGYPPFWVSGYVYPGYPTHRM